MAAGKRVIQRESFGPVAYYRFADDFSPHLRGTLVFQNTLIPGYPHIRRMLRLRAGILRHFHEPFFVEEKVDGYNLRLWRHQGELLPFTRGGFVDPFAYDRIGDFGDFHRFFDDHPRKVLIGEMAGPENPYIDIWPPNISEDVAFFVFDIYDLDQRRYLAPPERYELLEQYGLPSVKSFGEFRREEVDRVEEIVLDLNRRGIEGIVLKGRQRVLKYATPIINLRDLEADADKLLDLQPAFFIQRVVRLVLGFDEFRLPLTPELQTALGRAFLEGFRQAVQRVREEGAMYHEFSVRVHHEETIPRLLDFLNRASSQIRVEYAGRERVGDLWRARFRKVYLRSTETLKAYLRGETILD